MGSDAVQDVVSPPNGNASLGEAEEVSINNDSLEVNSSSGDIMRELISAAEYLTRVELDLACSSEKLVNLDILVMHVASREFDFEVFSSENGQAFEGSAEKALEFDLLYGFLDSEVTGLDIYLSELRTEISSAREIISSRDHLAEHFKEMQEKLLDCEECLKRSFQQLEDIKAQSSNFRRILLSSSGDEKWKGDKDLGGSESGNLSALDVQIKMHTAEQQRHVLRMLEKSLAHEIDLEKKLIESKQTEEDLKISLQQEVLCQEEEAEDLWERVFEAENSAEILLGISKELLGQIQSAQFNTNGSVQRENELRSKLQDHNEQLKESEVRAENAEAECKLLRESNLELAKDLSRSNSSIVDATEKVEQLEKRLKDSEIKRLHAEASAEASQENQNMLDCTIKDMEDLIEDLKSKVSKVEAETENSEEKCIILSEANAELVEEINFLRGKIKCMEISLHQADESKKATAKDIRVRTKFIADLIMQLALERERLHKQISSLTEDKKVAIKYMQQVNKEPMVKVAERPDVKAEANIPSEKAISEETSRDETNEEILESTVTSYKMDNEPGDSLTDEAKMDSVDSPSNPNTVRNIDATQLSVKYILMAILVLVVPALAVFLYQQ